MVFSCGEGLVLSSDGKGCVDKNECLYFPCRNGGSCVNREPGYRCHCPEGFWGENCELVQEGRTLKLSMGALAAILVCLLIIMSEHLATLTRVPLNHRTITLALTTLHFIVFMYM
jgi:Zn-finger protein